ncbi:MAG: aminotransferase class III-fold pyridoxal phosphate-dependent enzyme [Actinomycetes bacterium]
MELESARELVESKFGIKGTASLLAGERNPNFLIESTSGKFVLKIHDSSELSQLEIQQLALASLEALPNFQTPKFVPATSGQLLVDAGNGKFARMLTWIDGDLWSQSKELSDGHKVALGQLIATVDIELASVDVTKYRSVLDRPFGWNALQVQSLANDVELIKDAELKNHVKLILDRMINSTLSKVIALPHQLIHNDANDNNVVVHDGSVVGLIDFGDLIYAPRICGLAVGCAYLLDARDPVASIYAIVRGYHEVSPLSPAELEVLFDLICLRVATSVVMAHRQLATDPDNEYLSVSQDSFQALLPALTSVSDRLSHYRLRNACGYEAHPDSRHVRQWLATTDAKISDVVMPPFTQAKKIWLDWSGENKNIARSWDAIKAEMDAAGADIAIGHYCEDRNVYESDFFVDEGKESRTVHLAVDLFAPAGTPVYAALDGKVFLFHDNTAHLDNGPMIVLEHETDQGVKFHTLYAHLSRASLDGLSVGKEIKSGQQIATMGTEEVNVGWPPHTHFQLIMDLCDMAHDIWGVAAVSELPVWRSMCPNPNLILRIPEGTDVHAHMKTETLAQEREVVLSRALSLNFQKHLEIVRGEGAYLYDRAGGKYLDLVNNVAHLGHSHPRVVAAAHKQMLTLNTNTRYWNQNAIEYARALASTFPDPLSVVFFVNSGSEANDLALRLAQAHTKAKGMMVLEHAYHGHITSIIDISPYKFNGRGGDGRPDHVRVAPIPDAYNGLHRGEGAGDKYAAEFKRELDSLGQPLCAFISESIVSTGGQVPLASGFLKQAFKMAREAGGVCISDEVQIGMARVGTHFWGFEMHDVVPDIVTMGKPLGSGHPLAAVITTPEIAHSFMTGMEYFNTFGGNPVSAAIGQTVLDVIVDESLQRNALTTGNYLMAGVRELGKSLEYIGDVRGSGLFIGVELVSNRSDQTPGTKVTKDLIEFARENGVFLSSDGPADNVLKIKPPMIIGNKEVDIFLDVLERGLNSI